MVPVVPVVPVVVQASLLVGPTCDTCDTYLHAYILLLPVLPSVCDG